MSRSAVLAEKPSAKERRWTYQELRAEVEETNQPCELWHGRLIMPPSPSSFHQSVTQRLEEPLRRWVERRKLGFVFHGPLDVELAPDLVFQPDVLFIAKARRGIIKTHIAGAPDLVMEVVSPACPRRDYKDKKEPYERCGVKEYWIVDPDRKRIEVWALDGDFYRLAGAYSASQFAASVLLPGFKVRVDSVLAERW